MRPNYDDIQRRIRDEPKWWDEIGCPRFEPFHPAYCSDAHATEAALLRIRCGGCRAEFDVVVTRHAVTSFDINEGKYLTKSLPLREAILEDSIHYGDPPRHAGEDGMCIGSTMQSHSLQVLELWERNHELCKKARKPGALVLPGSNGWVRDAEFEGIVIDRLD